MTYLSLFETERVVYDEPRRIDSTMSFIVTGCTTIENNISSKTTESKFRSNRFTQNLEISDFVKATIFRPTEIIDRNTSWLLSQQVTRGLKNSEEVSTAAGPEYSRIACCQANSRPGAQSIATAEAPSYAFSRKLRFAGPAAPSGWTATAGKQVAPPFAKIR